MPIRFRTASGRKVAPPKTIAAAIDRIVKGLTKDEIRFIEENESSVIHFTMGMVIRNEWGMWRESSALKTDFKKRFGLWGMADDISGLILEGVWATVRGKDVEKTLNDTAEEFRKHWKKSKINPETGKGVTS